MEVKLQKWGNSMGIRIPNILLKEFDLKLNDELKLTYDDDKIIITKSKNKQISLAELFKNYKGKNLAKDFEWDESVGKEIW